MKNVKLYAYVKNTLKMHIRYYALVQFIFLNFYKYSSYKWNIIACSKINGPSMKWLSAWCMWFNLNFRLYLTFFFPFSKFLVIFLFLFLVFHLDYWQIQLIIEYRLRHVKNGSLFAHTTNYLAFSFFLY